MKPALLSLDLLLFEAVTVLKKVRRLNHLISEFWKDKKNAGKKLNYLNLNANMLC